MNEYIVPVDENSLTQEELEWFEKQGAKRLIRCKDCKWYEEGWQGIKESYVCALDYGGDDDFYCAKGEKKDG